MSLKLPEGFLKPYSNKHKLWFDGDVIAYRAAAVSNEDDNHRLGLYYANNTIQNTCDFLDSDNIELCFTSKTNFRNEVYPLYKANRIGVVRPKYLNEIKTALMRRYKYKIEEGFEADDILAREVYADRNSILVTIDKDLLQVRGLHYNFLTGVKQYVDEHRASLLYWRQVLTGDSTDNIPGLRGVGSKTAAKLIPDDTKEPVLIVVDEYIKRYSNDALEVLAMNMNLIGMQYTNEVVLHSPESIEKMCNG